LQRLSDIEAGYYKAHSDAQHLLANIHMLTAAPPASIDQSIELLSRIRREADEDLNQIQHECMIIHAAEWLVASGKAPRSTEWWWNARQTGGREEPDLLGRNLDSTVVSAEITTSESPKGTIGKRMRATLRKLANMNGALFYFVRTDAMRECAERIVIKEGWQIFVVSLTGGRLKPS
jgi:hypothetical protein